MRQSKKRRESILAAIASGTVDVEDLAGRFGVSPSTVRRDLQRLSAEKAVMRTYGGAILAQPAIEEPLAEREQTNRLAKEAIAHTALDYIEEGDTVILDGGSTVTAFGQLLRHRTLQVITNNIKLVASLADAPNITLVALGGSVRTISLTTYGPLAEEAMRCMTAAKFFTSADGLVAGRGLCEATLEQASLKRLMMRQAAETFVLADASKLGRASQPAWAPLSNRWTLITEAEMDRCRPFERDGARIVRVNTLVS